MSAKKVIRECICKEIYDAHNFNCFIKGWINGPNVQLKNTSKECHSLNHTCIQADNTHKYGLLCLSDECTCAISLEKEFENMANYYFSKYIEYDDVIYITSKKLDDLIEPFKYHNTRLWIQSENVNLIEFNESIPRSRDIVLGFMINNDKINNYYEIIANNKSFGKCKLKIGDHFYPELIITHILQLTEIKIIFKYPIIKKYIHGYNVPASPACDIYKYLQSFYYKIVIIDDKYKYNHGIIARIK